jgi:hypothetical protein
LGWAIPIAVLSEFEDSSFLKRWNSKIGGFARFKPWLAADPSAVADRHRFFRPTPLEEVCLPCCMIRESSKGCAACMGALFCTALLFL